MFSGSKGYNLSDIAAVTGNHNNNDGLWGNNGWWIILLFLFAGRGFGFGNNYGDGVIPATQSDVRAAVDQQTLISKLDNQIYGLADSHYALNNTLVNGFHGVDNAICQLGYQDQAHINQLSHQLSDCCCSTQRQIETGFCDTNYNLATQSSAIQRTMCDNTRDIIDNNNAGIRSILDFLTQDKISQLTAENQNLKFAASQAAQNNYLISELRPAPIPAYTVANPYCYYSGVNYMGC